MPKADRLDLNWHSIYECDKCGACCTHFDVSATSSDIQVQPALEEAHRRLRLEVIGQVDEERLCYTHNGQERRTFAINKCPFHCNDGSCGIYESRPNVCKAFKPGSSQCQNRRGLAGLTWLDPVNYYNTETKEYWYEQE